MWAAPFHITATHSRSLYLLLNTLSLAFPDLQWQPGPLCHFVLITPCSSLSCPPSYVAFSFIWSIFYLLSSMVRSIGEEMALPLWYCLYLFPIAARIIVMNLVASSKETDSCWLLNSGSLKSVSLGLNQGMIRGLHFHQKLKERIRILPLPFTGYWCLPGLFHGCIIPILKASISKPLCSFSQCHLLCACQISLPLFLVRTCAMHLGYTQITQNNLPISIFLMQSHVKLFLQTNNRQKRSGPKNWGACYGAYHTAEFPVLSSILS